MRRLIIVLLSVIALVLGTAATGGASQSPPVPRSMAAIGDSMTQAVDVCCSYGNHPSNSWSTGGANWDGISSHYERLRALNDAISGNAYNDAVSGAKMRDAAGQAARAVDQKAQYVTILMGANDVCTSSPDTMTSVDAFRTQYRSALATLDAGLSGRARIFVASIPDIHHLWEIYDGDAIAEFVWDVANICQSMLAPSRTAAERSQVQQRNIDFNTVLAQECAAYARCTFDDNAVYNYQFSRSQVSKLDYFHPSLSGQAELARITWAKSWWN